MRALRLLSTGLVLASAAACSDPVVPDLNNPSLEGVIANPTRSQVQSMATGLVIGNRVTSGPLVRDLEILGRDLYNLDAADPRWVTEFLIQFDPGAAPFGGAHWGPRYRNVLGANVMINGVRTADALSDAEKQAAIGFAQTMKGLDLLAVAETRDANGFAADAGTTTNELAPLLCRDTGLQRITALLDSANTALRAGSAAFPFVLPSGFANFDTPARFAQFNRAIATRAELYRAKTEGAAAFTRALTAVNASFVSAAAPLDRGAYHVFSLSAGDATNPLYQDPATTNFRVHPSVVANAEAGDRRVADKTEVTTDKTYQGVGSNVVPTRYASPTAPLPIVRNEELLLLRAQANIGLGNLAAAAADINVVRQAAGLQPRTYANATEALDDLLRQKRYSLLFESGSRWIDARLYNRLNTLPVDLPSHRVQGNYPIPTSEVLARDGTVACR